MTFENNLTTYNFNKETVSLLVKDGLSEKQVIETMETVGFSKELTSFLLSTSPTFYNSIMIRLKLYAKQNRDVSFIKNALNKFTSSYCLVDHLFVENSVEEEQDAVSLLDENVLADDNQSASDTEEENNPLQMFYDKYIVKETGGKLSSKESYEFFVNWFNENHSDETPDKKVFKKYLSDKLGKSSKNSWKNYSLNTNA